MSQDGAIVVSRQFFSRDSQTRKMCSLICGHLNRYFSKSLLQTPLHLAAERGNMEMVKLLIQSKADMALRDNNGNTPLDLAEQNGHEEVAKYLKDSAGMSDGCDSEWWCLTPNVFFWGG